MEKWRSDLVNAITRHLEPVTETKSYMRCPYCGDLDIWYHKFTDDGSECTEDVIPALCRGAFVYIPQLNIYGECAICQSCDADFYIYYNKKTEDLDYINKNKFNLTDVFIERCNMFVRRDIESKRTDKIFEIWKNKALEDDDK